MYNHFGRLTQEAFELDDLLQELEGDISDQIIQDWITRNERNQNQLINSAIGVIQEYQIKEDLYKAELDRLKKKKENYNKKIEIIKKMIVDYLTKTGKKSVDTGLFTVTVVDNSQASLEVSLEVINDPKSTIFFKEEPEVDNKAIREFIKEGKDKKEVNTNSLVRYFTVFIEEAGETELRKVSSYVGEEKEENILIATLKARGNHLRIS